MRTGIFRGLLVCLLLGAAGCGGSGSPASVTLPPLPSRTSAASPLGTPTPPPSSPAASATTPAAAAVRAGPPPKVPETKAGAELFIRDYFATLDAAMRSGKTATVRTYYDTECGCTGLEDLVDRYAAKREHATGPGFVLERLHVDDLSFDHAIVTVTQSIHHVKIVNTQGQVVDTTTDNFSHDVQSYFLAFGGQTWRIIDIKDGNSQ